MGKQCETEEIAELFNIQLEPSFFRTFLDESKSVHSFFKELDGYKGIEILMLGEKDFMVLIRWENYKFFDKSLSFMLNAPVMTNWLKNAEIISHQPSLSKVYFK